MTARSACVYPHMMADYAITSLGGSEPAVGAELWRMEDTRRRTLAALERVEAGDLDRLPGFGGNTIGSLLYHLAAIELDWLYADALGEPFPEEASEWFPYAVREDGVRLTQVVGEPLSHHLARLAWVRERLLDAYRSMTLRRFATPRRNEAGDYRVTPEWVLHHLAQHEGEHRGHIQALVSSFHGDDLA